MRRAATVSGAQVLAPAQRRAGRRLLLANLGTLCLIVASAFTVIFSTHGCRQYYAILQDLEASQWHLQEEHGRLIIEQSYWASDYRVEQVAVQDLKMLAPSADTQTVIVR